MKILAQNWRDIENPEAGGAEVHLYEILRRLAKKGHQVTWVSSKFKGNKSLDKVDNIQIIRIGNKFNFNFAFFLHYLIRFRKQNFDVIIDDVSKVPLCVHLYSKKPTIAIIHHIHGKSVFDELPGIMAWYVYIMEKILLSWFYRGGLPHDIVTVSRSTKRELIDFGIREHIHIVHNAINPDLFSSHNDSENPPGTFSPTIVYFGRVKRYKRIDHILRMFKLIKNKIPPAHLIIAGKGDNYKTLKNLSNSLKLNSVEFKGPISEKEKVEILKKAWVHVMASRKEGWGISVIEANACGVPVVGYDVLGLRDSIRNGYNGFLVEDGNIEELANKVMTLIENPKIRRKLSHNAKKWAKRFSWDKSAERFERILTSIVGD